MRFAIVLMNSKLILIELFMSIDGTQSPVIGAKMCKLIDIKFNC